MSFGLILIPDKPQRQAGGADGSDSPAIGFLGGGGAAQRVKG